ncbi:hypothetical protein MMC21_006992 [Puttea exsequens]|nr:hypothetical protein [Puttea exsequens]
MVDTASLAAIIVAAVALFVALGQLTQQLTATGYVIRKCDRIVMGGLTKGGTRQWHWRQFRFTVKYQALSFALPRSLYESIDVSPAVQVVVDTRSAAQSEQLLKSALLTRAKRTFSQASWITFTQDLAYFEAINTGNITTREESGDRIPDDLTIAPIRVDTITILLTCIALGMQVYKYSPTTGDIILSGSVGSISSSSHPLLGTLLHYNVFENELDRQSSAVLRANANALREKGGAWANAVFGRFMDRLYRPEWTSLSILQNRKKPFLMQNGWPKDSRTDTIGGAACFMAFAYVDCFRAVPPSCFRPWCAHFAEVIVAAHCFELSRYGIKPFELSKKFCDLRQELLENAHGSSPYLDWDLYMARDRTEMEIVDALHSSDPLASTWFQEIPSQNVAGDDPSSFLPIGAAWECVMRADHCMAHLRMEVKTSHPNVDFEGFYFLIDIITVVAIAPLAEVGAVSWGNASKHIETWPATLTAACVETLKERPELARMYGRDTILKYARLSILRAAYFTVMMRSAGEIGPGLTQETRMETALAYMA